MVSNKKKVGTNAQIKPSQNLSKEIKSDNFYYRKVVIAMTISGANVKN